MPEENKKEVKMSYSIPTWEISMKSKSDFRHHLVEALVHRALYLAYDSDRAELYVRELLPSDLGLERWQTPKQEAQTTATWVDCNLTDKIIGISKVVQLSETPTVTKISLIRGGALASYHQLSSLYGLIRLIKMIKESELELLKVQYVLE